MSQEFFSDEKVKTLEQDSEKEIKKAVMTAVEKCGYGLN